MLKYKRILLKLSGEALLGDDQYGLNANIINSYVKQISETAKLGVEIGIVIGGGNIFRGLQGVSEGFDRVKGDSMGMLATVINSIALQSAFESINQKSIVFTSFAIESIGERFNKQKVLDAFKNNEIAIFSGGTGNPFFTTDTASALRAVEIEAEVLLKGTRVDGIYSADPEKDTSAIKFNTISFDEVYDKKLKVMDLTAFTMCEENKLPIIVFDMNTEGNLKKLILGENIGSLIS
ncbi:MAG: UMP kinase [Bacteroidales bacterium]|nr:UMP kinase [Bacteroidales bacterium]MBN2757864.1 UMP kinase [Bacteroidales bacterium]